MRHPAYCDYCGEVIHNYHKMRTGEDMDLAIASKIIEVNIQDIKSRILRWIIIMSMFPIVSVDRRLCFCNQQHKDKFAKKIGLRIRAKKGR